MKKILFFVFIVILSILMYINLQKDNLEVKQTKKYIENDVPIKMPIKTEKRVKKVQRNKDLLSQLDSKETKIDINETEIMRKALLEIQNSQFEENLSKNAGFSTEGSRITVSKNPHELLSIKDMPKELQQEITELLEKNKRLGYDELTEDEMNDILNIVETIEINKPINKYIKSKLSKLSNKITSQYEYLGYAFPETFNAEDGEYDTVRRVFEGRENHQKLIIEETELNENRSSKMLSEFINTTVKGYPAEYSVKKSKSGKMYSQITWNTEKHSYTMYLIGESEHSMYTLQSLSESIKEQ